MKNSLFYKPFLVFVLMLLASCKHNEKDGSKLVKHKQIHEKKNTKKTEDLSSVLGISAKEIKSNRLFAFVDDWYGVPYKYGGCKKTGVDCSCFTNILYEQVYKLNIEHTAADIYKTCDKITRENAREGDFVFFKINGNSISHVGVVLKNSHFVHASTSRGVMVSSLNEAYFKKYFHSAGRLKNT